MLKAHDNAEINRLMRDMGRRARAAARPLATAPSVAKRKALKAMADALLANEQAILAANAIDMEKAAEAKLDRGMIEPENRLTLEEWQSGERVWLVDLVAPFADASNRQREIMIADLISGPLKGQAFKFHQTDPVTGQRSARSVGADAGEKLREAIEAAARQA